MGLNMFGSGSSYDQPKVIEKIVKKETVIVTPGMPNPMQFTIEKYEQIGRFIVIMLTYQGVTNFEGKKILVYENINIDNFKEQGHADPHFSDSKKFYSPIARFRPTKKGWDMARRFAKMELCQ